MNTTSITELPSENKPIIYNVTDIPPQSIDTKLSTNVSLDQTTINQIVNGLQKASISGSTQLQSRDVPINKVQFIDEQVQPEYIPSANITKDFIEEEEDEDENTTILNNANKRLGLFSKVDQLYTNLQIPFLLAILYFLFQLPIIKSLLFQYIPVLFFSDGNINIYGQLFMSILFGVIYHILAIVIQV